MTEMTPRKSCLAALIVLSTLLIVSCGIGSDEFPQTKATEFPSSTPTEFSSNNVTLTPNPPATALPDQSDVQYQCLDIRDENLQSLPTGGTLILGGKLDLNVRSLESLLFLNLKSGDEKVLLPPEDLLSTFSVSPQGKYLAYEVWNGGKSFTLKISDAEGNMLISIDVAKDWYSFEWFDDENLLIEDLGEKNNPFILFSPFTQEQSILEAYFAKDTDIFSDTDLIYYWGFYMYHKNVHDPHLTRTLYPSSNADYDPVVVLRDLVSGEDLAAFPTYAGFGVSPKWSPDGEKIAIGLNTNTSAKIDGVNAYEIFVIGRDGEILLSTNLTALSKTIYTSYLSWSPDSRYIAFRYTTDSDINENLELAVLDTSTNQITNYCITNNIDDLFFGSSYDSAPIWSPDSEFLLIETLEPETQARNTLIVDIGNGQAYLVRTGFAPIGWMK